MFGKNKSGNASYDTLVSAKTEIIGDIKFSGGLHIEGVVKGNLIGEPNSSAVVRISDKGRVEGQVSSPNIIINGVVNGDVNSLKYIELAKKAKINGNLNYKMMEMVLGAQVNGQLNHCTDDSSNPEPVMKESSTEPKLQAKPE